MVSIRRDIRLEGKVGGDGTLDYLDGYIHDIFAPSTARFANSPAYPGKTEDFAIFHHRLMPELKGEDS